MYVCHCRVVNDRRIRDAIEGGAATPKEVAANCGAGAVCAGCLPAIRELLVEYGCRPCACPCPLAAAAAKGRNAVAAPAPAPAALAPTA